MKKTLRNLLVIAMCCVMAFSLFGCGPKTPAGPVKDTPTAGPVKDTLTVILSQDSGTLDPMANNGWDCIQALRMVYEPLWEFGSDREIDYVLATKIDMVSPTVWHVSLRQGVKFANGNPFTADDVLFTITRANTRTGASALFPKVLHEQCKKIDEYTVEIVFDSYRVGAEYDVWSSLFMIDKESFDENTVSTKANGSGPYSITEQVINSQWTLTARDGYWGDPAPFKTLVFKILSEDTQKVNALETGSADICGVPFQDIRYAQTLKNVNVALRYTGQSRAVYFNLDTHSAFYDNDDARKAVSLSVDRTAVVNIAYSGFAAVSRIPVSVDKFDQVDSFLDIGIYGSGQDLEKAKALAESSGLTSREITIINNGVSDSLATAELIQDNLKKIGVTAKIWTLDPGSWKSVVHDATAAWDIAIDFTMGSSIIRGYDMWSNLGGGGSYAKNPWTGSERFFELKPVALSEPDQSIRTPMVLEMTQILADSLPWYSVCDMQQAVAYNKDLKNFEQRNDGYIVYTHLSW